MAERRSWRTAMAVVALVVSGIGLSATPAAATPHRVASATTNANPAPPPADPAFGTNGLLAGTATDVIDSQGRILHVAEDVSTWTIDVSRATAEGRPDSGFSGDDETTIAGPVPTSGDWSVQVAVDPTDRPVVLFFHAGAVSVWRLTSGGQPDSSFAGGGAATLTNVQGNDYMLAGVDSSSRVLLAHRTPTGIEVERLGVDGTPDPTFGHAGVADVACCGAPAGDFTYLTTAHVRADGTEVSFITVVASNGVDTAARYGVVLGTHGVPGPLVSLDPTVAFKGWDDHDRPLFAGTGADGYESTKIERLGANLAPDPSFGSAGVVALSGRLIALATAPGGVIGAVTSDDSGATDVLHDLTATGQPVAGFGTAGSTPVPWNRPAGTDFGGSYASEFLAALDGGGWEYVTSASWDAGGTNFPTQTYLDQYRSDGTLVPGSFVSSSTFYVTALVPVSAGTAVLALVGGTSFGIPTNQPSWSRYLTGDPALAPPAPAKPVVVGVDILTALQVALVAPPTAPDAPVTSFVIELFSPGGTQPLAAYVVDASQALGVIPSASVGHPYEVGVAATTRHGTGPLSPLSDVAVPPFANVAAFVKVIQNDYEGQVATAAQVSTVESALESGAEQPWDVEVDASLAPRRVAQVEPLTRLYCSFFQRPPDLGGFNYWLARIRAGATISTVAASFVASSEFVHTYGSLTDAQFVNLVYTNVLGRPADPNGAAFWTGQLAARKTTRAKLMVQFSESSENVRRRTGEVAAVNLFDGMLKRMPTTAELSRWSPVNAADTRQNLANYIMLDTPWASRFATD